MCPAHRENWLLDFQEFSFEVKRERKQQLHQKIPIGAGKGRRVRPWPRLRHPAAGQGEGPAESALFTRERSWERQGNIPGAGPSEQCVRGGP